MYRRFRQNLDSLIHFQVSILSKRTKKPKERKKEKCGFVNEKSFQKFYKISADNITNIVETTSHYSMLQVVPF